MMQFSLISLIPGLIRNLQDCADPELDDYRRNLVKPTSLKTSDRSSLLNYMGLPLQIFGKVNIRFCRYAMISLIKHLGKSFWSLHPFTATRHISGLWHEIIHCRFDKLFTFATERSIQ